MTRSLRGMLLQPSLDPEFLCLRCFSPKTITRDQIRFDMLDEVALAKKVELTAEGRRSEILLWIISEEPNMMERLILEFFPKAQ